MLIRRLLLLAAAALLCRPWPVMAADYPSAELAAGRGWQRLQLPGWEVPLFFPLPIGSVTTATPDSLLAQEGFDLRWEAAAADLRFGYPLAISVRLALSDSLGSGLQFDAAARQAALRKQLSALPLVGEVEVEDGLGYGERDWLRAGYAVAAAGGTPERFTLYVLQQQGSQLQVLCRHGSLTDEMMVDALLRDVLSGPVTSGSAFPGYSVAQPTPVTRGKEAAEPAWRMQNIPGYAGVLFLPAQGEVLVADGESVTFDELGADLRWEDPQAEAGHVYLIEAAMAKGAANPLAGGWEEQAQRAEDVFSGAGQRVLRLGERRYGGDPWHMFELPADGPQQPHSFALLGNMGLDALLVKVYVSDPVDQAALEEMLQVVFAGYEGLFKLLDSRIEEMEGSSQP